MKNLPTRQEFSTGGHNESMRLDTRALALASGLLWSGLFLFIGILQATGISPGYGQAWMETFAGIYPGFQADGSWGAALTAGGYAFLDGLIAGGLLGWLYNRLAQD